MSGARALAIAVTGLLAVLLPTAQASDGTFDRAWGKDVGGPGIASCTVAANCRAGTLGGLGGEFNTPAAVATDSAGNVYVADLSNERIQKFDSSGTFLRAWGKDVGGAGVNVCTVAANCQAGTTGPKGGEFSSNGPDGVATDSAGNVYVAEAFGNRIQKFDSSGNFLLAWGKDVGGAGVDTCTVAASCADGATGGAGGELFTPEGVATDSSGNVYVADFSNSRVQKFDSSGTFLLTWGKNVGGVGVATCTVAGNCHAGSPDVHGGEFSRPFGVGTDAAGSVYVTDASEFRVQKFDSSGGFQRAWGKDVGGLGVDICTVAANCQNGSQSGEQGGDFNANGPAGVATDAAGNVYVVDSSVGGRIQEFDSSGGFLRAWGKDVGGPGVPICTVAANCHSGSTGGLGGEFASAAGVATDATGAVYVTDGDNRRMQKFAGSIVMRTLTVSTSGAGAQTSSGARAVVTGPGIDCSTGDLVQHTHCSTTVTDGTQITLTATPASDGGPFTGFSGGGCGASTPCTVTMGADKSVDAQFAAAPSPSPSPSPSPVQPPSATIASPATGATYAKGQAVTSSFACTEGSGGPGISSCLDQSGHPSGAKIDTSTAGVHGLTVTATSGDGMTGTASVAYTVAAPPSVTIVAPSHRTYLLHARVHSQFRCGEGTGGPGIASCAAAGQSSGALINTSTAGVHRFAVTARSRDGQVTTKVVTYTVHKHKPHRARHRRHPSHSLIFVG